MLLASGIRTIRRDPDPYCRFCSWILQRNTPSREWGKTFFSPAFLALLVASSHRNTHIGPRWVDRTRIVAPQEFAFVFASSDYQAPPILLQIGHESIVGELPGAFSDVGGGKMLFPERAKVLKEKIKIVLTL